MLKSVYEYEEKLQTEYKKTILDPYFSFWAGNYWEGKMFIPENTWSNLMFVSIDKKDNINGYFKANIDRYTNIVTDLGCMNFTKDSMNITFTRDLLAFLDSLFTIYNFNKISFRVIVGNPAERMYDRYIKKYNGNIVGLFKKHVKINGVLHDEKCYEIFKEDYLEVKNGIK